ncbi:transposase [Fibrella arboris]|uniref:transposase n=1 Tax=Fibrella arboris TaxID=3242486 RepID=UPI00351FA596
MSGKHRRSIRLEGYDYSREGLYFITICTQDRRHWFGHILGETMQLSSFGQIAYDQWLLLPERFPGLALDAYQLMPNHLHGILEIVHPTSQTMNDIVCAYKSLVALACLDLFKAEKPGLRMGKLWQRNYYEHIIRSDQSYKNIADYIVNNPANWPSDKFYDT